MLAQSRQIQRAIDDERHHAGCALGAGNGNAVNGRFGDAGERGERRGNFAARDILALPAKRIADAIDEIEIAAGVGAHQIAGAVPGVAALKYVAQDFFLRFRGAGIALEFGSGLSRAIVDSADRLARFAGGTTHAKPALVAGRLLRRGIGFYQRQRKAMGEERRHAADGADFAFDVVERNIALGRRIELQDPWDGEPVLEFLPNISTQPVAAAQAQPMLFLAWL